MKRIYYKGMEIDEAEEKRIVAKAKNRIYNVILAIGIPALVLGIYVIVEMYGLESM